MFYIYIKIYSRGQLVQMDPHTLLTIDRSLEKVHSQYGGKLNPSIDGLYRYAAFYRETLLKVIEAAQLSLNILEQHHDELDGYNIIITRTEKKDYDLSKKMEYLVHQLLEDGGIWVDPDCYDELKSFITMEKEHYLHRMEKLKDIEPLMDERNSMVFLNPIYQDEIKNWITERKEPILILKGREGMGRRLNLHFVLSELYGSAQNTIEFNSHREEYFIFEPFIDCLSQDSDIPKDSEHGDFLVQLTQGKMMTRCSDFFSVDFENAFLEYLKHKIEGLAKKTQPLFIIVNNLDLFSDMSKRLLEKILNNREMASRLRFIFVTQNENDFTALKKAKPYEIQFTLANKTRVKDVLERAFPDTQWTEQRLTNLEEVTSFIPSQLFFGAHIISQGKILRKGILPIDQVIELLSDSEKELLSYIFIGNGMLHRDELSQLLIEQNDDESLILEQLNRLISMGLVSVNRNAVIEPNFSDMIVPPKDEKRIVNELVYINRNNRELNSFRYFSFLERYNRIEEALVFFNDLMNWFINNGFRDRAEALIADPPFSGKEISSTSLDSLQNIIYSSKLRLSLQEGDRNKTDKLISNGLLSLISERGEFAEEYYIQLARYHYCSGNMEQTINFAKDALYSFQKKGNHLGESLANIELAFAFMGLRKVQMGMDYFEIARRISYQIEDNYTLLTAHTFGALSAFLFGNISKAETMIEQVLPLARSNGSRKRIFYLTFLAGRCRFEYGHYREAADFFQECVEIAQPMGMVDGSATAKRWTGRSLLYLDKRREAFKWLDSEDTSQEGLFFLAESDFMVSLYESALNRLESAKKGDVCSSVSYSEVDFWCDGFMNIEGRFSSQEQPENVLLTQIEVLNSYILSLTGRKDEALQFFSRMNNSDDYPFKPYTYKYSYIHFTILNGGELNHAGSDNRLASLSRAIERLQSRAGRFDNQRRKHDIQKNKMWNKKNMDEAHRKKFI